jgi:hypothetical protein
MAITINGTSGIKYPDNTTQITASGTGGGLPNPIAATTLGFTDSVIDFSTSPNLITTTAADATLIVTQGIDTNLWQSSDSTFDLNAGTFNYNSFPPANQWTLELNFPWFVGDTQDAIWFPRYTSFISSIVGKEIRLLDPNNFFLNNYGYAVSTNFVTVTSYSVIDANDRRISLTLSGDLLQVPSNSSFNSSNINWSQVRSYGISIEVRDKIIEVLTNMPNTSSIGVDRDIIAIGDASFKTNTLTFSTNKIKMTQSLYAQKVTESNGSPVTMTTVSSVAQTNQLTTYSGDSSIYWWGGTAPTYTIPTNTYALYVEIIPDYYGVGRDRVYLEASDQNSVTMSMISAIIAGASTGTLFGILTPENMNYSPNLVTYIIAENPYPYTVVLNTSTPTADPSQYRSGWAYGQVGIALQSSITSINTLTSITSILANSYESALKQTPISSLYFGSNTTPIPKSVFSSITSTALKMSNSDYATYFPSGISNGSAIKYIPKLNGFPAASSVTYKNKLTNPIVLRSRENITNAISIDDTFGKITIGDDKTITKKYDTLEDPTLFSSGKIIWDSNSTRWKMSNDFFSELNSKTVLFLYADVYYKSPSWEAFSYTKDPSSSVPIHDLTSPFNANGPTNWNWTMSNYLISGTDTGGSQLSLRSVSGYMIIDLGYNGAGLTVGPTSGDNSIVPRIIITVKFRVLGE